MAITKELLKSGVQLYLDLVVSEIKRWDDEVVPGAIAIRAMLEDGKHHYDFLLSAGWRPEGRPTTAEDVANVLEECEWETWPPRQGKLRLGKRHTPGAARGRSTTGP